MAGEETPAGFLIDGKEYPIPGIETFDMDEAQLLWDYSGLTLEDFSEPDPDDPDVELLEAERQRKLRHPGLIRTLLHAAYQRGNPTVKPAFVKKLIGRVTLLEAMSNLADTSGEDDAGPPVLSESTSRLSGSSLSESNEKDSSAELSPESSGNGSPIGSDEPDIHPASTGTGRSATSSQQSAR